jgi:hypothetical protein
MLSFDGGTSPEPVLPKRRIPMQLELFPARPQLGKKPSVLARLSQVDHAALIRVLARLLVRTITSQPKGPRHER